MTNQSAMGCQEMLSTGPVQQGWGAPGPMMTQGHVGPSRMVPSMSAALPSRGAVPPGARSLNVQMMGSEMEMVNSTYPQHQPPPNQTAPWPDRMMTMDHYGNQNRPPYGLPHDEGIGCCAAGPEPQTDDGALLSQLCSVLKDFEGLEEIDKMLGIPTLAGQGAMSEQEQYLGADPVSGLKPPLYSQHLLQQQGYGGLPPEASFHRSTMAGHMGQQRMPPASNYPPMMRMPGATGHRPPGHRPGAPNPAAAPQPNNLRLQLQHRLQAQLNRQPMVNQMSAVSNMNLPIRSNVPNQGTLNAQMLAQRQREYLTNHLRQRQQHLHQQRALMMHSQGLCVPPSMPSGGAASTPMPIGGTNPRLPQGAPQQYPYPVGSYGTGLPSPPLHPGSSPLSPGQHLANVGGQYSGVLSLPQHSAFQFNSSGMSQQQQHQDPSSGFPCGAVTPQSPMLSPRLGQAQGSSMMQQNQGHLHNQNPGPNQGGPPGYQPSPDLNGWPQSTSISTSNNVYAAQCQSQFSAQSNLYSDSMSQMSGQMMAPDPVNDGSLILEQLAGMDMLTQDSDSTSDFC